MLAIDIFGESEEEERPAPDNLLQNTSGGTVGLQPFPEVYPASTGTSQETNGSIDCTALFINNTGHVDDVQGAYSHTMEEAFAGPMIENYGPRGAGYCLPDMTLGPSRNGYRGMNDEPLPARPPSPDLYDGDYDGDTPRG